MHTIAHQSNLWWPQKMARRAGAGLAVLLAAIGTPLAGAPSAAAETCRDKVVPHPTGPEPGKHTECRAMTITKEDLTHTDLGWADFTNSIFINTDLAWSKLDRAVMDNVEFRSTTLWGNSMRYASLKGAKLFGTTSFNDADVTGTQLIPPENLTVKPQTPRGVLTQEMLAQEIRDPVTGTDFLGCFQKSSMHERSNWHKPRRWLAGDPYPLTCRVASIYDRDYPDRWAAGDVTLTVVGTPRW
jgi:hypothetical protein